MILCGDEKKNDDVIYEEEVDCVGVRIWVGDIRPV